MSQTYHQRFRTEIALAANIHPTNYVAFKSVELAVEELNEMLQHQLASKQLIQRGEPEFERAPVVVINPVITGIEIRFIRDTGRFNGCSGEIMGQGEDRYHALILDVEFQDP